MIFFDTNINGMVVGSLALISSTSMAITILDIPLALDLPHTPLHCYTAFPPTPLRISTHTYTAFLSTVPCIALHLYTTFLAIHFYAPLWYSPTLLTDFQPHGLSWCYTARSLSCSPSPMHRSTAAPIHRFLPPLQILGIFA